MKPSRLSLDNLGLYCGDSTPSALATAVNDSCQQRRGRFKMLHSVQSLPNIWTRYSGSFSSDSGTESVMDTLPEVESTSSLPVESAPSSEDKAANDFTTAMLSEQYSQQEDLYSPPPVAPTTHEVWKQVTFLDQFEQSPKIMRRSRRASAKATGTNSGPSSPTVRHKLNNLNSKRLSCPTDTSSSVILAFNNGVGATADVDIVPVQLDMTVGEAVQGAVEARGLTLDTVDLYLALSARPVSLTADVTTVCGRRIVVRARRCTASPEETLEPQQPHQDFTLIPPLILPPPDNFGDNNSDASRMFIKRREQVPSSSIDSPAAMHRRYSHRPRNSDAIARGEPHPSVVQTFGCMPSSSDPFATIDEKTKRFDDEIVDSNDVIDSAQYSTWSSNDNQKSRALKAFNFLNPFVGKEKLEALQACLAAYSSPGGCGLPSATPHFTSGKPKLDPGKIELDKHWSHLVINAQALTKKECEQQEAIWELLETEVKYIRNVTVIINLFLACLGDLQKSQILCEIDLRAIFVNICDILNVNCTLWKTYLSKVVDYSKRTGEKLNPALLRDAFFKFETIFEPYIEFCSTQSASLRYVHDRLEDNELFRTFVNWAESQPQCNRLKLPDLIIMPMQRLTKYRLLLQAIHKKTESTDDKEDLTDMIMTVDKFVGELNVYLQQKEDTDKMKSALEKIESYEAIDPINDECAQLLVDFCQLDLSRPIPGCSSEVKRSLLLDGPLKMKDGSSKMDVQCFLFTDVLLITKPSRRNGNDKVKVIRPPMRLDSIIVWSLRDNGGLLVVHVSDYGVAIATYLLTGDVTPWLDNIRKAQESFRTLRALSEKESLTDSSDESEQHRPVTFESDSRKKGAKQGQERVRRSRRKNMGVNCSQPSYDDNIDGNLLSQNSQIETTRELSDLNLEGVRLTGQTSNKLIPTSTVGGLTDSNEDILLEDESLRGKLKERRSSRTEKRYLTADAIRDLAKEASKSAGIHKRFSWNSSSDSSPRNQHGTTSDILSNNANSLLTQRENTCESTESMNSSQLSSSRSSGVSSTMSFHAPSENGEEEMNAGSWHVRKNSAKFAFDESSLSFDSDSCLTESESLSPAAYLGSSKHTLSTIGDISIKPFRQRRARNAENNMTANIVSS